MAATREPRSNESSRRSRNPRSNADKLTIRDIAYLADVSIRTVSRVINNSGLVNEDTRNRVLKIIQKYDYRPNPHARALARRRSHLVALLSDQPNPQYNADMQSGILDALEGTGYQLVITPCNRQSPTLHDDICDIIEQQKFLGVILTPSISADDQLIRRLRDIDCPYVRIGPVSLDTPEKMVLTHDHVGAGEAARHLAELGHRRIAHIRGPDQYLSARERLRGFLAGLKEYGLSVEDKYLLTGGYTFQSGIECGKALLSMHEPPTAVFAGNDEMGIGIYQAARRAGLSVPDDLSIVGFDDSISAKHIWPTLTTVRLPVSDMGRTAVQLLASTHDSAAMEPPAACSMMPRLIVRGSTGPAPAEARP